MADFAEWATACETAFWPSGTFMAAYNDNLLEVVDTVLEADLVGSTLRLFAEEEAPWTGTASELLDRLRVFANESMTRSRDWPNSPDALSNRVRRAATFLRKVGVEITFNRAPGKQRSRTISISLFQPPESENQLSDASEVRPNSPEQSGTVQTVRRARSASQIKIGVSDSHGRFGQLLFTLWGPEGWYSLEGAHMSAPALRALAAANAAGVAVILDGDGLILDPMPSADLVAELKAVKPDLLRVLAGRVAARAIINTAEPPPDCSEQRWVVARRGLKRFLDEGWGDQATLLGWTVEELYAVPPVWPRVDLCGAALLIADRKVVAVTEATITTVGVTGSHLKFYRRRRP